MSILTEIIIPAFIVSICLVGWISLFVYSAVRLMEDGWTDKLIGIVGVILFLTIGMSVCAWTQKHSNESKTPQVENVMK